MLIEAVRGKPVNPKYEGYVHALGFVLLFGLMIVVTFNDIVRLFRGEVDDTCFQTGKSRRVLIGGDAPVSINLCFNRPAADVQGNVRQAVELEKAGCEIVRVAIPDMEAVRLVGAIKSQIRIPLVADIHFDYRLALECVAAGIDKVRINPGNIGDKSRVRAVVKACKSRNIPIRIGVNSGSLEKDLLEKYGAPRRKHWWKALCAMCLCWKKRFWGHCYFHQIF